MVPRRSSRRDDEDGGGRRRRYTKQTNWGGIVGFFVVFGILAAVAYVLYGKMGEPTEAPAAPGRGVEDARPAKPPERAEPAKGTEVHPDRPAPELKGEVIIQADSLFQEAKKIFAEAERAGDAGKTDEHDQLVGDCRAKLAELHALLRTYTAWHEDAKRAGWPIPKTYATLERRVARYGKLEARLPQKNW